MHTVGTKILMDGSLARVSCICLSSLASSLSLEKARLIELDQLSTEVRPTSGQWERRGKQDSSGSPMKEEYASSPVSGM